MSDKEKIIEIIENSNFGEMCNHPDIIADKILRTISEQEKDKQWHNQFNPQPKQIRKLI